MTRTTPLRRINLHFSQIRLMLARTFIVPSSLPRPTVIRVNLYDTDDRSFGKSAAQKVCQIRLMIADGALTPIFGSRETSDFWVARSATLSKYDITIRPQDR